MLRPKAAPLRCSALELAGGALAALDQLAHLGATFGAALPADLRVKRRPARGLDRLTAASSRFPNGHLAFGLGAFGLLRRDLWAGAFGHRAGFALRARLAGALPGW